MTRRTQLRRGHDTDFEKLRAPARLAFSRAGYTRLDQLVQVCESALKILHGIGATAIAPVRVDLDAGLSFCG
jgi:hypothetical protein